MRIDYFVVIFLVFFVVINIISINIPLKRNDKKEKSNINTKDKEMRHDMENVF